MSSVLNNAMQHFERIAKLHSEKILKMKRFSAIKIIKLINLLCFFSIINGGISFAQYEELSEIKKAGSFNNIPAQLTLLQTEVKENLIDNILRFWSFKMLDESNGGFYGRIDGNNKNHPDAVKGGILNSRILWTFSSAFRILKDSTYLLTANRARDYILAHFIDKEFGGAYLSVNSKGNPKDKRKQIYNQAFFIYALSEYYLATGDMESLSAAKEIYNLVEDYSFDKQFNGYFEIYSRDWKRIKDKIIGEKTDDDQKGMNTHLHLMEAYANLYRAWPNANVEKSLRNLIELFYDRIVDKRTSHLIYFSDEKWVGTSPVESYGHDIEASWLLVEAVRLLKDPVLTEKIEKLCVRMVIAASEGLQPDGSMIYERNKLTGQINLNRDWWTQAETVVGFVNAWQLTGNESYLETALKSWKYIDENFVDHKNGEWFNSISGSGIIGKGDKAGYWKCPYHNSRMCLEIIKRASD
jgi:cellobiose epimerase